MQLSAEAIARDALATTLGEATETAMLMEAMRALVEQAQHAQAERNGRELTVFEKEPWRIGRLADLMRQGNYAETAARLAGVSASGVRAWLAAADKGEERYLLVSDVIRMAEAMAESESVNHVRAAGREPRNWAASMTFLERRHPSKWARRPEDNDTPRVLVQIGVRDSDVQVNIGAGAAAAALAPVERNGD